MMDGFLCSKVALDKAAGQTAGLYLCIGDGFAKVVLGRLFTGVLNFMPH